MLKAKAFLKALPLAGRVNKVFKAWRTRGLPDFASHAAVNRWLARRSQTSPPTVPYTQVVGDQSHVAAQFIALHKTPGVSRPDMAGRRILVAGLHNPTWVWRCLPIAVALAGRGASVDYAWAQFPDYLGEMPGNEYLPGASSVADIALAVHPNLRLIPFAQVPPAEVTDADRASAARLGYFDACHYSRRETCRPATSPADALLIATRTARNLEAAKRFHRLFDEGGYDWVVMPNGAAYEYGTGFDVAQARGLGCGTFDCNDRHQSVYVGINRPSVSLDTSAYWAADAPHDLSPARRARVTKAMMQRELPGWNERDNFVWHGQLAPVAAVPELLSQLALRPDKPTALLCTNLSWDSTVLGRNRTFASMIEWILETVGWFVARPDRQLVVRVHPVEKTCPTNEPVVPAVRAKYPDLPPNIRLVDGGDAVNTYGLMRLAHCGLVYTTTTGIEMAMRAIPTVVVGRTHYAGHGFTIDPPDPPSYFAQLEHLLGRQEPARLPDDQTRLAMCYWDVFFENMILPFPWNMRKNEDCPDDFPVAKLIAGDCPPEYLRTLDFLAGLPV